MTRERGCLAGDALLQVAVAGDDVHEVVERRRAGRRLRVEQAALVAGGVREAHRGREALTERTRGDLHAVGVPVLGVTRRQRTPRAERLQIVELEPEPTQVQLHVLRQRRVPCRQDEPVPADPVHIGRVVVEHTLVQEVRRRSEAHRRPRVAVAHLLDSIRRQHASRVHSPLVDLIPTQFRHGTAFHSGAFGAPATHAAQPSRRGWEWGCARGRACLVSISKGHARLAMCGLV